MRVKKPRVSLLYESAIAECKSAGVELTPEEYIWIYEASRRAIDGAGNECPSFIDLPVTIGNVTLWPMTLGAMMWWNSYGDKWYSEDKNTHVIAFAFCLANAKEKDLFSEMNSKVKADLKIVAWQSKTSSDCTITQLAWGIDKLNGQYDYIEISSPNETKVRNYSSTDWGVVIAKLCGAYHQPAEYFLWRLSQAAAIDMLINAPAPFGYTKEDNENAKYFGEFREVVAHIIKIHKYQQKQSETVA